MTLSNNSRDPNPSGLCLCGCGQLTPIARWTSIKRQTLRGKPQRYCVGHGSKTARKYPEAINDPNPSGLCQCGCGRRTTVVRYANRKYGIPSGGHRRFCLGHHPAMDPFTRYEISAESGCWIWQGAKSGEGYGSVRFRGQMYRAHRLFYEHFVGPIPTNAMLDHLCRNPSCVNPKHLEPVSNRENVRRGAKAKLDAKKVAQIRSLFGSMTHAEIANRFDVSASLIDAIRAGVVWRDE